MSEWREMLAQATHSIDPRPDGLTAIHRRIRRRERDRRVRAGIFGVGLMGLLVLALVLVWTPKPETTNPSSPAQGPRTFGIAGDVISAAAHGTDLWVLTCSQGCRSGSARHLERLDGETGRISARVSLKNASSIAADDTGVWVMSTEDSTVTHLDGDGAVLSETKLELPTPIVSGDTAFLPQAIAVGEGAVWVASDRGELARLDPANGAVEAYLPITPDALGGNLVAEFDFVWIAESLRIAQLSPADGKAVGLITISRDGLTLSPTQVEAVDSVLWVSGIWTQPVSDGSGPGLEFTDKSGLASIDPMTGQVTQIWDTASGSRLVSSSRTVWVVSTRGVAWTPSVNGELTRASDLSGSLVAGGPGVVWTRLENGHITASRTG